MRLLEDIYRDLRLAVRSLVRSPSIFIVVIVTVGLGIGANVAMFSVVNAVVLEPLHVAGADRLVRSATVYDGRPQPNSDAHTFKVWRDASATFEDVSAHRLDFVSLADAVAPEQLAVGRVSALFFHLFHASVVHGRVFDQQEDLPNGPHVAVLSHRFWTRRFGGEPSAVGHTVLLGNVQYLIVGVLGDDFRTEQFEAEPDVWVPLQADPERVDGASIYQVSGRLKPGITVAAADAQLRIAYDAYAVGRESAADRASRRQTWAALPLLDAMVGGVRSSLAILLGAVALLLLIACANVANILLVRADLRQNEMAIRAAMGAGRGRLIRQLLVESALLSCGGAVFGLVIGPLAIRWLLGLYQSRNPFILGASAAVLPRIGGDVAAISVDWRVAIFTIAVSMVTTVLFGLLPARQAARRDLTATLHQAASTTPGRYRGRALLVIAEVALALVLVLGAALLVRTSAALRAVDSGLDPQGVLTMRMPVAETPAETQAGISELIRRGVADVQAIPGVRRVSTACCMPLETVWQLPFRVASRGGNGLKQFGNMQFHGFGGWTFVSPGYFEVFGIPLRRGRDFTDRDDARSPGVVIINEAMARQYWPNSDPLNDQLVIGRGMRPAYDQDPVRQIIGIVGDVRDTGLTRDARPALYVPTAQLADAITVPNVRLLPLVWIVRTSVEPGALGSIVSRRLEAAGGLPVTRIRSMTEIVSEATARTRFDMWMMTVFGVMALFLAAIGVYGLVAFWVQRRAKEIGIRVALGADATRVATMVIGQGIRLAVAGVVLGTAGAFALARVLASLLFGVQPHDPLVFAIVPLVLMAVAFIAVVPPAWRASRIDPLVSLRSD